MCAGSFSFVRAVRNVVRTTLSNTGREDFTEMQETCQLIKVVTALVAEETPKEAGQESSDKTQATAGP